ncbi:MAG: DUF5010 domain-containing protein [Planctomycetes bacterium]|nr:DUF5010 domain-containing protein [Planctomycetota bacterium]
MVKRTVYCIAFVMAIASAAQNAAGGTVQSPCPPDGASVVGANTDLHWTGGGNAVSYDVYLGTDYDNVLEAVHYQSDLNESGQVGVGDLAVLAEYWLTETSLFDLTFDDYIDLSDFAVIARDWLNHNSAEFMARISEQSYEPGTLQTNMAYYWRVDEIEEDSKVNVGQVWNFSTGTKIKDGILTFVDDFNQADLTGGIVYAINCGGQSDITVGQVNFRGDVYQWHGDAGDINGDGNTDWWDNLYNANCPGKPASASPIAGVTVECSDSDTGGMDHGPYEGFHSFDVSGISGLGNMAQVLSTSGVQNLGNPGERDMIYRLDVSPGHRYKLQLFFFKNSIESTGMDVLVEGNLVIDGLDVPVDIANAGYDKSDTLLMYSSVFTASDSQVDIVIRRNVAYYQIGEINAITLEDLDYDREKNIVTEYDSVVNYDAVLSWDPVADADSYNVYFGTPGAMIYKGNTTDTTYDPGPMVKGQAYNWQLYSNIGPTSSAGPINSFHVRQGYLSLLDEIEDVDLDGCIIYGINCGKSGPVSDASIVINNVMYKPDMLVRNREYLAYDTNGDGTLSNWHDQWYNATNPGKPTSPTPIHGMTVECSDFDTNGMDHGLYEDSAHGRVTSTIFPDEGKPYFGIYPPADDTAQGLRYLMYFNGVQNAGSLGERNMVFRFDTIPGHNYKLQILFFHNRESSGTHQRALSLYIRPDGTSTSNYVTSATTEKAEMKCNVIDKIERRGGLADILAPNAGLVYTYEFVGDSDGRLDFEVGRDADDTNISVINAIIIEDVSPVATNPTPMNGEYYTSWKQKLSWDAAVGADSHDVYLGTDYNTVRGATTGSTGIYKGNQPETTYDPGNLNMDTTYFWRIDEVDGGITTKGETWSFTPGTDTTTWKIIDTEAGEWLEFHHVKYPADEFRFTANLSTNGPGKSVRLELNGTSLGSVALPDTNGLMRKIHLGSVSLTEDYYDMKFVFETGGIELDYIFVVNSDDTSATIKPEDTLLVPPSGAVEFNMVIGGGDHTPCPGWPNTYSMLQHSSDIYNNHDAFNNIFYDYHIDLMLSARISVAQHGGGGQWDPAGVDDHGPFVGIRPGLPRMVHSINRIDGAREMLTIAQFDASSLQVRNFYENGNEHLGPIFNAETDQDHYYYWMDYVIAPFWDMVPRDMWYERNGFSPWYCWWDAPHNGCSGDPWWQPCSLEGLIKPWIQYLHDSVYNRYGTNLYFGGQGAQYEDSTVTSDDVQFIVPLMTVQEDTYEAEFLRYGIGQWNWGNGQPEGEKYSLAIPGFRSYQWPAGGGGLGKAITTTHYSTEYPRHNEDVYLADDTLFKAASSLLPYGHAWLDFSLSRIEAEGCAWVNLEGWEDKGEDTCMLPSTDTRVFNYPNEYINIMREHADPLMLSVRFEAEQCDYYNDTTTGNNGTDYWQLRSDPDTVNDWVAACDLDIDRLTGSDIGIAVNPFPLDCEVSVPLNVTLTWVEARDADSHDVYFGTDKNAVMHATTGSPEYEDNVTTGKYALSELVDGTTYYWRIDEVYGSGKYPSKTWKFTVSNPYAKIAAPADGTSDIAIDSAVTWFAGENAVSHDVYFSTDYNAVLNGQVSAYKGNQSSTSYDLPGDMAYNTTYHWRIDEVTGSGTYPGPVWDFTTEIGASVVVNSGADILAIDQVTLNGEVTDIKAETPTVTVYWGDNDGGTNTGNWDAGVNLGAQSGTFSTTLSGLNLGTTYYYRCYTSNSYGAGWADSTDSFRIAGSGIVELVSNFNDIDLTGNMIYALNCGSTSNRTVGSVVFKADVYQWQPSDVNGDGSTNWHDNRYNANCPGKPASPSPITGVTVECSDSDTNGMDHGPYENYHSFNVSSLFSGQGTAAWYMAQVLSVSGMQNLGTPGERDMIYRLDVTPGEVYKLQLFFFKNSTESTGMDVIVEGDLIIDGLDVPVYITNAGSNKANTALMYTYTFAADDSQVDIVIKRDPSLHNIGDINAITLEDM